MSNEKIYTTAKDLKEGRYLMIEDVPCKVVEIEKSKSGKHGAAKMRITGIGVFDGQKKTMLTPGDANVEVPIIQRKNAQVMSVSGTTAQVMDIQTYEMYDVDVPAEVLPNLAAGKELEIIEAMGRRKVERVR